MLPRFNSHPYHPNQIQTDGTSASAAQQVMPSNHCQGNHSSILPNSVQIQSHMGLINPQIVIPFNNSNTHWTSGTVAMPNRPISLSSACFMNATNHHPPLQNGVPLLGSAGVMSYPGQCQGVFGNQNLNSVTTFPVQNMHSGQTMNTTNPSQPPGQLFAHNCTNLPQNFNQNGGLPNGQFCLQSPMQNMNQFVQMQMPNYAQLVPYGLPPCPNQLSQARGPQNPSFLANMQFGLVHSNGAMQLVSHDQNKFVPPMMDVNASKQTPNTTQQLQGNPSLPLSCGSVQPQQTQKNLPPHVFMKSQEKFGKDSGTNNLNTHGNNFHDRSFTRNPKRDASHSRFPKSQFHHMQNVKGKFGFHNEHGVKGYNNGKARKSGVASSSNQSQVERRRSLCLNYTEQEIQQWREERRKNHPSKTNIEKKLRENLTEPEATNKDAKLRRQQLKEILAKQAELGCEVAEIPSYYLSDSEKQVNGREANNKAMTKKDRYHNKSNKRGRFHQNDRFSKKQRLTNHDSCEVHDQTSQFSNKQIAANNDPSARPTLSKKEPTLLQKLLSADIRRGKSHMLQVFRFMVKNEFFKEWPEKPLRFPVVIVKESGSEGEVGEEKSLNSGKCVSKGSEKTMIEAYEDGGDDYDVDNNNGNDGHLKETVFCASLKGRIGEEEEGEIID